MIQTARLTQLDYPSSSSPTSRAVRKRISSVIRQYRTRREAKNSARSAKPSFSNIEKEMKELEMRKRAFREAMNKAVEKLGDMSVFEKYRRGRGSEDDTCDARMGAEEWSRSRETERLEKKSASPQSAHKPAALTISVIPEDFPRFHRHLHSQGFPDFPLTTQALTFPSPKEKSTPMHLDPKYHFALKRTETVGEDRRSDWSEVLDGVSRRCRDVEESCVETRRETIGKARAKLRTAFLQYERVTDMVETLQSNDHSSDFFSTLRRRRASKQLRKGLLAGAPEVKKSFLDTSEFVAKHAHKDIWRLSSLSLARHADKLINSLPITRGAVKGKG